jgi:hypothetical protein
MCLFPTVRSADICSRAFGVYLPTEGRSSESDRPEWSVASDAEGGSGERSGPIRTHLSSQLCRSVSHSPPGGLRKGEAASVVP